MVWVITTSVIAVLIAKMTVKGPLTEVDWLTAIIFQICNHFFPFTPLWT
jgi:hypothetical protein